MTEFPNGMDPWQKIATKELEISYHQSLADVYEEKYNNFTEAVRAANRVEDRGPAAANWEATVGPAYDAVKAFVAGLQRSELESIAGNFFGRAMRAERQLAEAGIPKPGSTA